MDAFYRRRSVRRSDSGLMLAGGCPRRVTAFSAIDRSERTQQQKLQSRGSGFQRARGPECVREAPPRQSQHGPVRSRHLQPRAHPAVLEPLPRCEKGTEEQTFGTGEVAQVRCACRAASSLAKYKRRTSRPSGQNGVRWVRSISTSRSAHSPPTTSEVWRVKPPLDVQL